MKKNYSLWAILAFALSVSITCIARAGVEVEAGDYIALPPGSVIFAQYLQNVQRDGVRQTDGSSFDASLNSVGGATRVVHYWNIGSFVINPQIVIPYAKIYDGSLEVVPGGLPLASSSGLGDISIGSTVWLVNEPSKDYGTYFGLTPWLWIPTGNYEEGQLVNVGENRWKADLQLGLEQGLGSGYNFSLYADVQWFGDNKDYKDELGRSGSLSQSESYQLQSFLSYHFNPATIMAIGLAKYWKGKQYIDGVANGFATDYSELRISAFHFLDKTTQMQIGITRELDQEGGFERDLQVNFRFAKLLSTY